MDLYNLTYVLAIAAMIFSLYAQFRVHSIYKKHSRTENKKGLTGAEAAQKLLESGGITSMTIEEIPGSLTDHYDPRSEVLRLSKEVMNGKSLSALGIAAHEAGHALQHGEAYGPLMARQNFVGVANFGSKLSIPIVFLGIVLMNMNVDSGLGSFLVTVGLLMFSAVVLLSLITLPVEFNASARAVELLESNGILTEDELVPVKQVLRAASWTYIAATLSAVLTLLRLVLMSRGSRRR
ncbi:MAG: zinc metallopeptidase [Clostridiales bacterium]|jgi:Zn-dependent membrane protease YugP|nr:zinc metallopeptidase [Clostridiales bacterium]